MLVTTIELLLDDLELGYFNGSSAPNVIRLNRTVFSRVSSTSVLQSWLSQSLRTAATQATHAQRENKRSKITNLVRSVDRYVTNMRTLNGSSTVLFMYASKSGIVIFTKVVRKDTGIWFRL